MIQLFLLLNILIYLIAVQFLNDEYNIVLLVRYES